MAERTPRRRVVTADIADDGSDLELNIHGPKDDAGKYPVVDGLTFNATSIPQERVNWFALYGIQQILSNRWNRLDEDATPADVRSALAEIIDAIADNTWTPGRTFAEREPTDLELAVAEATGLPVSQIMDDFENKVQLDEHGEPKLDKRGRKMRVFTQRMQDALANDAKIKPILARIVAERAKRLQAEAKRGGGSDLLGSMFGTPVVASADSSDDEDADTPQGVAAQ